MADVAEISASAPGSLMILGEHAVLHGRRALVCAINRRITVRLFPMSKKMVRIASMLGSYECPIEELADHPSFRFAIQAIRQHADHFPSGCELQIDSEFPADIGFGSSAAVTVATHAVITTWLLGKGLDRKQLFAHALKTVHAVQGRGSGADLAASVFGGIVCYTTEPSFQTVVASLPLTAVYCGYKTPTPEVILKVEKLHAENPQKYERIYAEIDASAEEAVACLRNRDFPAFGKILNHNQHLMDEMGVNTPELQQIVEALQMCPGVFGAKISGSGLGDCAVGIGYANLEYLGYPVHHLEITPKGCDCHD